MALRTQFLSDGSTVNGASDFIAFPSALTTDGIIKGLQVTAPSSGMTVNVAAGQAILGGLLCTSDTAASVSIPTNTGSSARTDIIVLQIDSATAPAIKDVSGTTTAASDQIILATVTVPVSASSIVAGNISASGRVYAGLENPFAAISAATLSGNGYVQLGNGLALQWGTASVGSFPAYTGITYPKAFDTAPYAIVATMEDSAPSAVSTAAWTASKFTVIQADSGAHAVHWMAIGPMAVSRS